VALMPPVNRLRRQPPLRVALAGLMAGLVATGNVALAAPPRSKEAAPPGLPRLAVVAVAVDPGLAGAASELSQYAEQAVVRSGRFEPVLLATALEGDGASGRVQKEADAEAAMAEGRRVYEELDTVAALAQFEKAANLCVQTDLSRTFQKWVDAQLLRAACLVANGELKVAEVELDRVLALEPRAQLSADVFPPDLLAYAEKVKKSVLSLATTSLKVTTSPAGARIYLDGRFRGVSPVELTGLTQADHFVTAVMPGRTLVQRRARSGAVSLELPYAPGAAGLDQAVAEIRVDPQGPGRDKALRALGQSLKVDQLLAVLVRRGALAGRLSLTGLRVEMSDGHNAGWAELELPADDALAVNAEPFLSGLLGTDAPRRGGPVTHFAKQAGGGLNMLAWGGVGGGAALVAGGVVFGALALGKAGEYRGIQQTSPEAAATASTGRTYALVADVGVLAGLVTAGVGTYLALTATPAKAAPREPAAPAPAPPAGKTSTGKTSGARVVQEPAASAPPPDAAATPTPPPPEVERKKSKSELEEEKRREKAEKRKAAEEAAQLEREEKKRATEEKQRQAEEQQAAERQREARKREAEAAPPAGEVPAPPLEKPAPVPAVPERVAPPGDKAEAERRRADEERARRDDDERKKREEDERKKREEDKKKRRRTDDEDDLRNY